MKYAWIECDIDGSDKKWRLGCIGEENDVLFPEEGFEDSYEQYKKYRHLWIKKPTYIPDFSLPSNLEGQVP